MASKNKARSPRTRGDDPDPETHTFQNGKFAPHTRG